MIDIKGRYDSEIARRRHVYPQHTNRASSLGHPCLRYLTYVRTDGDKAILPSVGLQKRFEDGAIHEDAVLDICRKAGLKVTEQQRDLSDDPFFKKHAISGHIDAMIADPETGEGPYPFDVKSCSRWVFEKLDSLDDMRRHRSAYVRSYPAQVNLYLLGTNKEEGGFILKSKESGDIKIIPMQLDWEYAEQLVQKADAVNAHVAAGTLPEPINDAAICGDCAFQHICSTSIAYGTPPLVQDDPELIQKVTRWQELKVVQAEYTRLDEELKERFNQTFEDGNTNLLIGDWHIEGNKRHRKGYAVQEADYWARTAKRISGEPILVNADE